MILENCATGTLSPFVPDAANPWDADRVKHLYRRLGYGATKAEIDQALTMSPTDLVDAIIDGAIAQGIPTPPYWANYTDADYNGDNDLKRDHQDELRNRWLENLITESFQSKMALFWHNHFVTDWSDYNCNRYAWEYFSLLHEHAFGNFRTFVEEMGVSGAMLIYLDGFRNTKSRPNENYGRELMELFTMGESIGYTQDDIVQVSKALTGWKADRNECTDVFFDQDDFSTDSKTIFGQTGNWGYDDVHELIFTLRKNEVAQHICTKLYRHFIYEEVNQDIIDGMAQTFLDNNFELAPVIRQLLKSAHFFNHNVIGSRIKSHLDIYFYMIRSLGLVVDPDLNDYILFIYYETRNLGQQLFSPVNVAGWPGHRAWLNENTLTYRWAYSSNLVFNRMQTEGREKLRTLALELTNQSNDPYIICNEIANHFLSVPLSSDYLEIAVLTLKGDIPENYFEDGSWNLYWDEAPLQLTNLLNYLMRLPEYQLY